ncbi:MAG: hypothetical protein NW224_28215 [Leptolyngbyaceae cyanobacterium bins.302]|nr:hypothetical protein [Leptolyngbyaceae cyanobacterium bins.302]
MNTKIPNIQSQVASVPRVGARCAIANSEIMTQVPFTCLYELNPPTEHIFAWTFSVDSQHLILSTYDSIPAASGGFEPIKAHNVKGLNAQTGAELWSFSIPLYAPKHYWEKILIASDNETLVGVDLRNSMIQVCNLQTGNLLYQIEVREGEIADVVLTPDASMLISGTKDKMGRGDTPSDDLPILEYGRSVRLWDIKTGQLIKQLGDQTQAITQLAVTPNGRFLLSGHLTEQGSGNTKVWDLQTGNKLHTLKKSDFVLCPDGITIAVPGSTVDNRPEALDIINWQTGETLRQILVPHVIYRVAARHGTKISQDGRWLFISTTGQYYRPDTIHVWDFQTGEKVGKFPEKLTHQYALSLDSQKIAVRPVSSRALQVWSLS